MSDDNAAVIADRRRQQWQRLPADQRIKRVHRTVAAVIAYDRWRRAYLRQRSRTDDFLLIEREEK